MPFSRSYFHPGWPGASHLGAEGGETGQGWDARQPLCRQFRWWERQKRNEDTQSRHTHKVRTRQCTNTYFTKYLINNFVVVFINNFDIRNKNSISIVLFNIVHHREGNIHSPVHVLPLTWSRVASAAGLGLSPQQSFPRSSGGSWDITRPQEIYNLFCLSYPGAFYQLDMPRYLHWEAPRRHPRETFRYVCFFAARINFKTKLTKGEFLLSPTVSLKTRTWIQSRKLNVSVRGGWQTMPGNAWEFETSTKPSRSWVACASCTWKARNPRLNCSSSIRLWLSYLTWSSKSEVSVLIASPQHCCTNRRTDASFEWFLSLWTHRAEFEPQSSLP